MKRDKSGNILLLPSEKAPVLEKLHEALPALGVTELPDVMEYIGNVDGREYFIGAVSESLFRPSTDYFARGSYAFTRCILSSREKNAGQEELHRYFDGILGNSCRLRGSHFYGSHIKGSEIRMRNREPYTLRHWTDSFRDIASDIEDMEMIRKGIDFLSKNEVMQEQRKEAENFFRKAEFRNS